MFSSFYHLHPGISWLVLSLLWLLLGSLLMRAGRMGGVIAMIAYSYPKFGFWMMIALIVVWPFQLWPLNYAVVGVLSVGERLIDWLKTRRAIKAAEKRQANQVEAADRFFGES